MLKYEQKETKGRRPLRNVYLISPATIVHNKLIFSVNDEMTAFQIIPAKQVLVDSDACAFIYIVEEGEAFSYVSFGEATWPQLLQMVQVGENPLLQVGDKQIELVQFAEELESLLYNIEGNSNYGENFVSKVETAFQAFYEGK